jgi:hypothetical protein
MNLEQIIALAEKHANETQKPMKSSALFSLNEARLRLQSGMPDAARSWAVRSLSFSVGIFHADYSIAAGI